jgi:hypothetical protein
VTGSGRQCARFAQAPDGYRQPMTEPLEEKIREVDRGRDPKTPFLALTGVTIVVALAVVTVLAIVAIVYWLV